MDLTTLSVTSDGRKRDVLKMKWSSAVRLKRPDDQSKDPEDEDESDLPEAEVDV